MGDIPINSIFLVVGFLISISVIFFLVRSYFAPKSATPRFTSRARGDNSIGSRRDKKQGSDKKNKAFGVGVLLNLFSKNNTLMKEMYQLTLKAGMRHNNALEQFIRSKIMASIALFFVIFALLPSYADLQIIERVFASFVLAVIMGHRFTNLNLIMVAKQREEAINNGVSDFVDLLIICVESGLDLGRSIKKIADELRISNPILGDELGFTSIELDMMPDYKQAFLNLENRTNSGAIKIISRTLSQSIEHGASLSKSLRNLAAETRRKKMLRIEAKAAKIPTLLILPMVFFTLPCLLIVMIGPVILQVMSTLKDVNL